MPSATTSQTQIPEGFPVPPLNPSGVQLRTVELAPDVYALMGEVAVDNNGFVVGERGVLVIDAHINGRMAAQIQAAVREVTDKPILYLVNTNFHGDHTFGNYAFPAETTIIAHRKTAERMREFEQEKALMLATVDGDASQIEGVTPRLPDQIFDDFLRVDLGGKVVEMYHFGAGNTPGDTVVYVPDAKAAWTGNFVIGEGTLPFLIEGGAEPYVESMARFAGRLDVKTIVPGHGPMTTGAILGRYLGYLGTLIQSVRKSVRERRSLVETIRETPLWDAYAPPAESPLSPFVKAVHEWNVRVSFEEKSDESCSDSCVR